MLNIYLPGMSQKNEAELESFKTAFETQKKILIALKYRHWGELSLEFDFQFELDNCKSLLKNNLAIQVNLICKSVGTALGAKTLNKEKIKINKLVLMGIPSDFLKANWDSYRFAISNANQVLVLLNEKDPYVDHAQVDQLVQGVTNLKVEVIKGIDNHMYYYADKVLSFIDSEK